VAERPGELLGDLRGRGLAVVLGGLVCQLALGFGYVYGPLLSDITADLGLSRAAFSSARSATLVTMAAASPLLGWLVVRVGVRPVLVVSTLLIPVVFAWISRAELLWQLFAGQALFGLVMVGLGDITVGFVVSQWIVRGRGLALGIVYTGSNLGALLAVPVASWLAIHQSWRTALLCVGIGGAALVLPAALALVRERRADDLAPAEDPAETDASMLAGGERVGDLTARQAARTRSFWILVFAMFSFFMYFLAVLEHFVASLTDAGLSQQEAVDWYRFAIAMGLVSKIAMGLFADRLSPKLALRVDYGLLTLSSLLLLMAPASGYLQAFVVVFGFSYAARDVVTPLAIVDCFGVRYLPTIYGALMMVLAPAGTLGSVLAGWCYDTTGGYDLVFRFFAAANGVVLAALFLLRRERAEAV
jgi:predicted MFS family arabinose efflux permease